MYDNLKEDTDSGHVETLENVQIETLMQDNVQMETLIPDNVQAKNLMQQYYVEVTESSNCKSEDLDDLQENQDIKELGSAESSKTKAELYENQSSDAPNESYDEGKEWWNKLEFREEKIRAMQMIESQQDLKWFESSKVKNYYTSQDHC